MKSIWQTVLMTTVWLMIMQSAYWLAGPIEPAITVDESRSEAWETTTKPGGSVTRMLTFRANQSVTLRTYRRLVEIECDKCRIYELEQTQRSYEEGIVYRQARSVSIPEHIPPGRYRVEVDARWRANPFRDGLIVIHPYMITVVQ